MKFLSKNIFAVLFIFMLLAGAYSLVTEKMKPADVISISQLAGDVNVGKVKEIGVSGDSLNIVFQDGAVKQSVKESDTALSQTLANYGVSKEQLAKINVKVDGPTGFGLWTSFALPFMIPVLVTVYFFWMMIRQAKTATSQAFSFGKSRARIIGPNDKKEKITFKDVAGAKEAKAELEEIVEFLKNPKKFLDIGARIPKGVLLMGAPGTGKTLMARAVAGEAGVPFFHISGSEFVELFVGIGASRVRDLFNAAKKAAPAIVFIDEIDAVGRQRGGAGFSGGHDEREQTLNQILVEMDGFEPHEKVIVMAATNRPDVLDVALLRPGRFDRRVIIDLPDIKGREEILRIHANGKPFDADVDLKVIAERTPGFSGADLQNLMNESAILTARANRKKIIQLDLIQSIEKVLLGPERKSHLLTSEEKKIASYHEAGHAVISSVLVNADPVHKVSVVSRGKAAGYTLKLPLEERHLYSRAHFLDEITVALGGYAAEKIIFKDITTGASDDLARSTDTARSLVTRYGMSDKIGPVSIGEMRDASSWSDLWQPAGYSEETVRMVDAEVSRIMSEAETKAKEVLMKHKDALKKIANVLIERETIEREEFDKILTSCGIKLKKERVGM